MKSLKPTPNSGFYADASVDGFPSTYWTCGTIERKQQCSLEMIPSEDRVTVKVHGISKKFEAMNAECKWKRVFWSYFKKWKR